MQQTEPITFTRTLLEIVLLAALYVATARLGQTFAISPGNVTPVWIPSGIIIAAALVRGSAIWPGIWLGAFIGNAWAYLDWEDFSNLGVSFISASANGFGDTLCALVAAQLIIKFCNTTQPFSTVKQVTYFILFGAIVAGAISAVVGVTGLAMVGFIDWSEYVYVWLTWWIGDGVGVLLVAPILLTIKDWRQSKALKQTDLRELAAFMFVTFFVAVLALKSVKGVDVQVPLIMLLPVLLWGVVRFSAHVVMAITVGVSFLSIWVTAQDLGPFSSRESNQTLIDLQLFLFTVLSTVLVTIGLLRERASIEVGLEQTENRYRRLFDKAVGGIIITDEKGRIESFNEKAEKIFGYEASDVVGRNVSYLAPMNVRDNHQQYMASSQVYKYSNVLGKDRAIMGLHRDGYEFPIHIKISELVDNGRRKFMAVVDDVSQEKKIEAELHSKTKEVSLLKSTSFDAFLVIRSNKVESVNGKFFELFGYSQEELEGKPLHPKLFTTDLVFVDGQNDIIQTEGIHKNGRRFPVDVKQHTEQVESDYLKVLSIRDQALIKKLQADLEKANNQMINANQAKSKFLSSMSHELRTPMNAIVGFAQLLEMSSGDLSQRQKESIQEIRAAGKQLLGIIDDILDLAKIEAGQFVVNLEEVNCTLMVAECVSFAKEQANKRAIKIFNHLGEAENYIVKADAFRLKQVLLNLLSNAVKFNHADGTVAISAEPTTQNRLRISVTDSGVGLSEDEQSKVFEPFEKVGTNMTSSQGPGIGLVITKSLVELMGGEIGLESYKYMGSTFWVEFELLNVQRIEPMASEPQQELSQTAEALDGSTVLYIDNDAAHVRLMRQLFERLELGSLLTANNGMLGLEAAKDAKPDLILLEKNLPGLDGYELLDALKADASLADIPVIILSGDNQEDASEEALREGATGFVAKPVELEQLSEILVKHLKNGNGCH